MFDLTGKIALVTGAASGIGEAIAVTLARAGAFVYVADLDEANGERVAVEIRNEGSHAKFLKINVAENADCLHAAETIHKERGRLDILVNNAGIGIIGKTVEEMAGDEFRQTLETNLFGVFYACHYGVPMLKERGGGYIINISSLAGQNAHPRMAAYNASKFGLNGFSEALMQEVRQDNIKLSYICPGSVNTFFGGDVPSKDNDWQLQPEDIAQTVCDLLEMPERALPSKIEIRPSKPPKK